VHLSWLALVVPAVLLSLWVFPNLKRSSVWFFGVVIFGSLAIAWAAMGFETLAADQQNLSDIASMMTYRLIAATDLPLLQLMAGCAVGWLCSRRQVASDPITDGVIDEAPTKQPAPG
jgi:hypothetical protein